MRHIVRVLGKKFLKEELGFLLGILVLTAVLVIYHILKQA